MFSEKKSFAQFSRKLSKSPQNQKITREVIIRKTRKMFLLNRKPQIKLCENLFLKILSPKVSKGSFSADKALCFCEIKGALRLKKHPKVTQFRKSPRDPTMPTKCIVSAKNQRSSSVKETSESHTVSKIPEGSYYAHQVHCFC